PLSVDRLQTRERGGDAGRQRDAVPHGACRRSVGETLQRETKEKVMADTLVMELKSGPVKIKLRPDLAPNHVERIKELAGQGFYDGIVFHRVIPNFMAQTG